MQNHYGQRIKELRTKVDLTQKEFANKINVSLTSLSAYEQGTKNPSFDVFVRIAKQFHVSTDWLCGLSDNTFATIDREEDVIKILIEISKHFEMNVKRTNAYDSVPNTYAIEFSNDVINAFCEKWQRILNLYDDSTIDRELYDLWCENELKAIYNKKEEK